MTYLNLGCGSRHHPDWINLDIVPQGPEVIASDFTQTIPLPDVSCEVVYHSHVLEHLRREHALKFMKECRRVLKPRGILRVAVPDLERIARAYLQMLEGALMAEENDKRRYDWILLEMYDQAVRERVGGGMASYLAQSSLLDHEFVYERIGEEGRKIVKALRGEMETISQAATVWKPIGPRLNGLFRRAPVRLSRAVIRGLLGVRAQRAFDIGRFRLSGEVHHWMYDRYSLARLMQCSGFRGPRVQSATQSLVPEWPSFDLDTSPDGTVRKPDSLFMEAIRSNEE